MDELTKRQKDVLNFVKEFMVSHGYPPTVREICDKLGLSSPATAHTHLSQLELKGYIKKSGNKNRAIELLVDNEFLTKNENIIDVPLLGKITAGKSGVSFSHAFSFNDILGFTKYFTFNKF
jgi:repressor LexA